MASIDNKSNVWRLVLTGGPCGGKTTGQARLCTFFENLGWKVYRVPETANILLSGGVKFADLSPEMAKEFQSNLLKTMLQIEDTCDFLGLYTSQNSSNEVPPKNKRVKEKHPTVQWKKTY